MISKYFYVMDENLDFINSWQDENDARHDAAQYAEENEVTCAVMLRVPVAGFPELRCVAIFEDGTGRCLWETDVYTPELVG